MALPDYPAEHFPGTPNLGKWVAWRGAKRAGVIIAKWVPIIELIARFESDWNPYIVNDETTVCPTCRGMMQCGVGMYEAANAYELIASPDYTDPIQAVQVSLAYILSKLVPYYGGYGSLGGLLDRSSVGDVVEAWIANPDWGYSKLRPFYSGY